MHRQMYRFVKIRKHLDLWLTFFHKIATSQDRNFKILFESFDFYHYLYKFSQLEV